MYSRSADKLITDLQQHYPKLAAEKNPTKPRSKSFEVTGVFSDGSEGLLWSGLKLGPPRKLKFPDPDVVLHKIKDQENSD